MADETEEALFKAHFTDGKNIDDNDTLRNIGVEVGIPELEIHELFAKGTFADEVREDEVKARSIGIRGVPFFIFNNKYAISGAQAPEFFLQTLIKAWDELQKTQDITVS